MSTGSKAAAVAGGVGGEMVVSTEVAEIEINDESIFVWEKHIDKNTGEVYFFNPKTGVSQWDPPTVRPAKKSGK